MKRRQSSVASQRMLPNHRPGLRVGDGPRLPRSEAGTGGEGDFRLQPATTPIGRRGTHAAVRASALRIIASVSASP